MNSSLDSSFDVFKPAGEHASVVRRGNAVNRTHRVVRQRAKVMQARRSRMRGLIAPLVLCSVLLISTAVAVWSGLYQSQAAEAAEAVQADVAAALAASDASNHFLVVLLWFAPVVITVLGIVVFRRVRSGADGGTAR
jgi:hypothetical protein